MKQLKYTAKEKRVYLETKKEGKVEKENAACQQKIMKGVWADAQTGIDQKVVDEREAMGQWTRCTVTIPGWKHCQKDIRVSTNHRKSFKLPGGRSNHRKPTRNVATSELKATSMDPYGR